MNEVQKAYIAGLFDGEACFQTEPAGPHLYPRITINMTCEKTIRHVQQTIGHGIVHVKKTNPKHSAQWRWRCAGKKAQKLAAQLLPYLVTKHEIAETIAKYTPNYAKKTAP